MQEYFNHSEKNKRTMSLPDCGELIIYHVIDPTLWKRIFQPFESFFPEDPCFFFFFFNMVHAEHTIHATIQLYFRSCLAASWTNSNNF